MLKKTISIFIVISLVITSFSHYWVYLGFEINKKFISKNLCENRMRPEMECNGKCYLMKKLKQVEENDKKQDREHILKNLEISFIIKPQQINFHKVYEVQLIKRRFSTFSSFYSNEYTRSIFHPPQRILSVLA